MATKPYGRRRTTARRGASLVEAAVVLAVWLLIVFAAFDLCVMVFRYNTLSEGARRLARTTIVHGSTSSPDAQVWGPGSFAGTADSESDIAASVRAMLPTMNPSDVLVEVEWIDDGNDPDQRVHIQLSYDHQSLIPFGGPARTIPLRGGTVMRIVH